MRSDVRSSFSAPDAPAACSISCLILSRRIAMRSSSSDSDKELSSLIMHSPQRWVSQGYRDRRRPPNPYLRNHTGYRRGEGLRRQRSRRQDGQNDCAFLPISGSDWRWRLVDYLHRNGETVAIPVNRHFRVVRAMRLLEFDRNVLDDISGRASRLYLLDFQYQYLGVDPLWHGFDQRNMIA